MDVCVQDFCCVFWEGLRPKVFLFFFRMVSGVKVLSSLFQGIMEVVTASSGSLAPNPRARRQLVHWGSERIKFFVLRIVIAKMFCEISMCPR